MTAVLDRAGHADAAGVDRGHLLRLALKLDAVASGALGALLLAAEPILDRPNPGPRPCGRSGLAPTTEV